MNSLLRLILAFRRSSNAFELDVSMSLEVLMLLEDALGPGVLEDCSCTGSSNWDSCINFNSEPDLALVSFDFRNHFKRVSEIISSHGVYSDSNSSVVGAMSQYF
jgi:hypothetical protein